MSNQPAQTYIPNNDPHFRRVVGYARSSDVAFGAAATAAGPGLMLAMEKFAPSFVGKGGFARIMRLTGFISVCGGFLAFYNRSLMRFYGMAENQREVDMDMREMVGKVKRGEPLYGVSQLDPHMQGVAARQSRYSGLFSHVVPWFNFVNHSQHGVDTAKYYRQAERELEADRMGKAQDEVATLA